MTGSALTRGVQTECTAVLGDAFALTCKADLFALSRLQEQMACQASRADFDTATSFDGDVGVLPAKAWAALETLDFLGIPNRTG